MRGLWEFLTANPILFLFIGAWVIGAIGNAVRSRNARQKREEARSTRRQSDPIAPAQRVEPRASRPTAASAPPPVPQQQPTSARGPDEIAAEMRRILGLEQEPPPRAPEVMPRVEPVRRPAGSRPVPPELPPTPLAPATAARMLERHIDPHVGEGITSRKAAGSGRVGKHDRAWGSLGGRRRDIAIEVAGQRERIVDFRDLKRIIVGAEILGPPIAFRDLDSERRA